MALSLRSKLVILLLITGMVPLLAGLGFVVFEGHMLKRGELGGQYRAMASTGADALKWSLHEHVVLIVATARSPFTLQAAATASACPFDEDAAMRIDKAWIDGVRPLSARMEAMTHPMADSFRQILQGSRRKELFLTDKYGRVFACGHPTSDYLQADESWWQKTYNDGQPRVYISPVNYDQSTAAWSVDVCAPLIDSEGYFQGVCKAVVDLGNWVRGSGAISSDDGIRQYLLDSAGMIVYDGVNPPYSGRVEVRPPSGAAPGGDWVFDGDRLIAAAPVDLGSEIEGLDMICPKWMLMLEVDSDMALAVVRRTMLFILLFGSVMILAAFLVGLLSVQSQIVRPILRLRNAARLLAGGEFEHRISDVEGVGTCRELDELVRDFNRMADAVEKSHDQLQLAYEMKSRFVTVAGHELKTPLAYILAMSSLLTARGGDERTLSAVKSIEHRARRLEGIITGMLKLSSEGDGPPMLVRSPCDVGHLLQKIADAIAPFVDARGQQLNLSLPAKPVTLDLDEGKIADAVFNLLSNAVKFTPDGGTVSLSADLADGMVRIAVSDQGSGISDDQMPHIFEPFWGGGEVLHHSSGEFEFEKRGAGLGLPVARYFVELHGGAIEVRTTPAGCVFTIMVPVETRQAPESSSEL